MEVLVLEDEEGVGVGGVRCGVKEDVTVGFAGDGEAKWGCVEESESQVGVGVGEEEFTVLSRGRLLVLLTGGRRRRRRRWWAREDIVGDFPTRVVGIGDSDPQAIVYLQADSKGKELNIRAINRGIPSKLQQGKQ